MDLLARSTLRRLGPSCRLDGLINIDLERTKYDMAENLFDVHDVGLSM